MERLLCSTKKGTAPPGRGGQRQKNGRKRGHQGKKRPGEGQIRHGRFKGKIGKAKGEDEGKMWGTPLPCKAEGRIGDKKRSAKQNKPSCRGGGKNRGDQPDAGGKVKNHRHAKVIMGGHKSHIRTRKVPKVGGKTGLSVKKRRVRKERGIVAELFHLKRIQNRGKPCEENQKKDRGSLPGKEGASKKREISNASSGTGKKGECVPSD